jgi:hypothetical protein
LAVGLVVVALTAGGIWWILAGGSKDSATPAPSHSPCQPIVATAASGASQPARTDDWEIDVTGSRAAPSVPAQGRGAWDAAPGELFVVVEVRFRNLHTGSEASLSTRLASLECSDGTVRTMAGFDGGRGYCRVCQEDLGTDQRQVRWAFIFRMERANLAQRFRFQYADARPIDLTLAAP